MRISTRSEGPILSGSGHGNNRRSFLHPETPTTSHQSIWWEEPKPASWKSGTIPKKTRLQSLQKCQHQLVSQPFATPCVVFSQQLSADATAQLQLRALMYKAHDRVHFWFTDTSVWQIDLRSESKSCVFRVRTPYLCTDGTNVANFLTLQSINVWQTIFINWCIRIRLRTKLNSKRISHLLKVKGRFRDFISAFWDILKGNPKDGKLCKAPTNQTEDNDLTNWDPPGIP